MPFVKLDCQMLDSTTWADFPVRNVFIAALLMAEPYELVEETRQIHVRTLDCTDFTVPPGWYGLVRASGPAIIKHAEIAADVGTEALERLGNPDICSRSQAFEGRRLVRIDGGYIVLNFDRFRRRDMTAAERNRRYRARRALQRNERYVTRNDDGNETRYASRDVTVTEAEAEACIDTLNTSSTNEFKHPNNTHSAVFKKTKTAGVELPVNLPSWINSEIWKEFMAVRKQRKAVNSPRAFKLLITELEKLRARGEDPNACIEQSIVNAWKDVYPKNSKEGNQHGRQTKQDILEQIRNNRRSPDFGSGALPYEKPVAD